MNKKERFLEKLNEAFAKSDTNFIITHVTDDIRWTIIGEKSIQGKEAFRAAMNEMKTEELLKLTIHNIITHGNSAAVNGEIRLPDGKIYAFCDVYQFNGSKELKIKELTSYVHELKPIQTKEVLL